MGGDSPTSDAERPKHLTKQEFGRRLYRLMTARGWNQSELARQAQITRDAVSTYIRGVSLPEPKNLQKLAETFGMSVEQLLPNQAEMSIDRDPPAIEMKVSALNPSVCWLRINRLVETENALQIMTLLRNDNAGSADGE